MKTLKVHENKQYLMWDDGTPFYYLADTAWELAHKLNRNEIEYYMNTRKQQGFNVIQVVALAEKDGLRIENAYGHLPFLMDKDDDTKFQIPKDPSNYWTDLDALIDIAKEKELFIGLLPTWGDKFNKKQGYGPEIFNEKNAYEYGKWLGKRYADYWNIIWILGGDRPLETKSHETIIDAMAKGLKEGDFGSHLITFHPSGAKSSSDFVPEKDYIDFHTIQSGHGMECYASWELIRNTKELEKKPCMDMESRYERFPACFRTDFGYEWDAADIRHNNYWNMMEGVCGHTYGHRAVWCFHANVSEKDSYHWQSALDDIGAMQMQHLKKLRLSRPYFEFRRADELLKEQTRGMGHQCAARGEHYAFIYSPLGLPIYTDLESFGGQCIKASWYNPRTGEEKVFAMVTWAETLFVPPTSGKGNDWILILDRM